MADDPSEGIYRAMIEGDDGMPVLGSSAELRLPCHFGKDF
jgi:hypothetical protein